MQSGELDFLGNLLFINWVNKVNLGMSEIPQSFGFSSFLLGVKTWHYNIFQNLCYGKFGKFELKINISWSADWIFLVIHKIITVSQVISQSFLF